jgi:hypothetical protein
MDLVGYSTLLLDEQRQYHEQLTEIVRGTEQVRGAKEAGKLIRLPVGDGMALVFFDSPEAPVRCAMEISKKAVKVGFEWERFEDVLATLQLQPEDALAVAPSAAP